MDTHIKDQIRSADIHQDIIITGDVIKVYFKLENSVEMYQFGRGLFYVMLTTPLKSRELNLAETPL